MKKLLLLSALALTCTASFAQTEDNTPVPNKTFMQPVTPTYLDNVYENGGWNANWFLSVKGGITTFAGNPAGHGDMSERLSALLNISAGKWITPTVGLRLGYQGIYYKTANVDKHCYSNVHLDVLYDMSMLFKTLQEEQPRWKLAPFVGVGFIKDYSTAQQPFALSYGIMGQYRLTDRLHIAGELGVTTTFQKLDGMAYEPETLGDHLIQASIGFAYTIGKAGWSRVTDPKPYIYQNDQLIEQVNNLFRDNEKLKKDKMKDELALMEMRKILEIEGLLDKYELVQLDSMSKKPKGSYSGLTSLRSRLRNKNWNGKAEDYTPVLAENTDGQETLADEDYLQKMKDGSLYIGSPIFFFFKLNKSQLTETAQIININEIAATMKKYGLYARVVGAADSQTGTAYGNEKLSEQRAKLIANTLMKKGVPEDHIIQQHQGGINKYVPEKGNRNTCVMLFYKAKAQ